MVAILHAEYCTHMLHVCICVSTSTVVVHTHTRVIRVIFSRADAKIYVDQVQYHGRVHALCTTHSSKINSIC